MKNKKVILFDFLIFILYILRCFLIVRQFYELDDDRDQMVIMDLRVCYKIVVQNILIGKLQDILELLRQMVNIYVCFNYLGKNEF